MIYGFVLGGEATIREGALIRINTIRSYINSPGLYSPTVVENVLSICLRVFLYLEDFKSNTTSDWLNHTVFIRDRIHQPF